jgi:hypothetical protein
MVTFPPNYQTSLKYIFEGKKAGPKNKRQICTETEYYKSTWNLTIVDLIYFAEVHILHNKTGFTYV